MPAKLRIALWLGVLLGVIFWCFPGEPMHEGLTLSEWLEDPHAPQTEEAITQFGTNSIPIYLNMLKAKESEFRTKLIKQLNKLPLVDFDPFTAMDQRVAAVCAFEILGTNAQSAYPTLLNMLKQDDIPAEVHWALMAISPKDRRPTQIALNHSNPEVRLAAVHFYTWGGYRSDSSAIPVDDLLPFLQDTDLRVRHACLYVLGIAAETNSSARASIELSLNDKHAAVRSTATNILQQLALGTNSWLSIPEAE